MLVGAAQIDISLGNKANNLEKCIHFIESAGVLNVSILVFPECTLTGYMFNSVGEAMQLAETVPGRSTEILVKICRDNRVTAAVGLLEKEGKSLYNTAVLISTKGIMGKYRKIHRIILGVDRFIRRGKEISVINLPEARVGLLICYDQRFPEPARVLGLGGVQIILALSNLPVGAEAYAGFLNRARACENRVFLVSANRIGSERGAKFLGQSQIIDFAGVVLAESNSSAEEILISEVEPQSADIKRVINAPGEYEFDIFQDRRPELYNKLKEDKNEDV